MKRVLSYLMFAAFLLPASLFAGASQETEAAAEYSGKVEIVVPTGGFYVETIQDYLGPLLAERYPGIDLVVSPEGSQDTSGTEALKARLAAGDIPDIYIGPRGAVAAGFVRERRLVVLDSLPGIEEITAGIMPNLIDRSLGGLYSLPYEAITTLMLYNVELFQEAGLDSDSPPETWDEFIAAAQAISGLPERSWGAKVYGATTWTEALNWGSWYWNMLAPIYANFNDGKPELFNEFGTDIVFDQPDRRMLEFFTYMRELHSYAPDSMENKIWQREVGIWPQFGVGWRANLEQGRDQPMVLGDDVAVAPIPVYERGMTHWTMYGGRGIVMFRSNPQQEALAWEVLKLMYDEEFYLEYCKDLSVLPVLPSVAGDEFFQGPEIRPFVEALEHVVEEESFPAWDEVANIVLSALGKVMVTGEMEPEEALAFAASEARKVLAAQ